MNVDVVILSNTVDSNILAMTQNAIDSLHNSETEHTFNIALIETNVLIDKYYFSVNTYFPGEKFNYNRFLNYGISCLDRYRQIDTPKAEFVVLANNDLIFQANWFSNILKAMNENNLDSASPRSPGWFTQVGMETGIYEGYDVGQKFCGWCLVYRRESLDQISPLDEQFEFWCQDNDMALSSHKAGQQHALVADSIVYHLANQSHRTVADMNHFTNVMIERFHKKWG